MEIRDFKGCFLVGGVATETVDLRIILSSGGGGEEFGSGSFALPLALVGHDVTQGVTFRTNEGAEIALDLREIDTTEGVAYFLTRGAVPALRKRA